MRNVRLLIAIVGVLVIVGIAAFLYLTRDIAAPSQPIDANLQSITPAADSGTTVFSISQAESQVEYNIYELLNGADKTVVGTTNQIAGEIAINLTDLAQSQISEIRINARTFATDSSRRDNAVARFVLQSEATTNEFILFQPTALSGLPGSAGVGDTLAFQVTGDLTIAGVTQAATFDVSATLETASRLVGQAETIIQRAAYNLRIPSVPSVANVGEDVTLRFNFVADAV